MHFDAGPRAARLSALPLRLAALALLIVAVCTVAAHARPGTAEPDPDPVQATPPSGDISTLDRSAIPTITWKMAHDVPVWKTVSLGAAGSVNMLLEALDSEDCGAQRQVAARPGLIHATTARRTALRCRLGDSAGEIIGRPAFHLSRSRHELDLVVVSLIELGFPTDENPTLEDIHARADMLGFALCPAEVGPQLRLQYLDQPVGEFLHIGMQPIETYAGEPVDFTIGNSGSGLLLIGGDGRDNVTLPPITKFIFVRRRAVSSH